MTDVGHEDFYATTRLDLTLSHAILTGNFQKFRKRLGRAKDLKTKDIMWRTKSRAPDQAHANATRDYVEGS